MVALIRSPPRGGLAGQPHPPPRRQTARGKWPAPNVLRRAGQAAVAAGFGGNGRPPTPPLGGGQMKPPTKDKPSAEGIWARGGGSGASVAPETSGNCRLAEEPQGPHRGPTDWRLAISAPPMGDLMRKDGAAQIARHRQPARKTPGAIDATARPLQSGPKGLARAPFPQSKRRQRGSRGPHPKPPARGIQPPIAQRASNTAANTAKGMLAEQNARRSCGMGNPAWAFSDPDPCAERAMPIPKKNPSAARIARKQNGNLPALNTPNMEPIPKRNSQTNQRRSLWRPQTKTCKTPKNKQEK